MLPPGPRGLPILGSLLDIRRDPAGTFLRAAREFGDVAHVKVGPRQGFLITNPADIRHVLQDNARNYHKSPLYERLRTFLGNGLLTSEDDFWLRQRRIAQPAFHHQRLAGLATLMAEAARDAAAGCHRAASAGQVIDVDEEMMRLTRTVVLRALLGGDLGPFTDRIDQAWVTINTYIGESFWSFGFLDWLPSARRRRFDEARRLLMQAVDYVIEQRRRSSTGNVDLLSMLLTARYEDTGEGMSDDQLRTEVTTFLLAGQETTSLALTWIWYLLSQHPAAERRLEDELDAVLDGRLPEFEDLPRLPYTRMVIDEALRLYPPAWGFSRQALGDDELGGYRLPKGWMAFVVPWAVHRVPALWEEPDAFEPERFSPERSAVRSKFAYIPFGGGPRRCIGDQFALIEVHLTVATIAQRYRFRLAPGHLVEPWPLITLRPRAGMPMVVEARSRRKVA